MARVGANHTHHTFTADDLAITADGFDRSRNSHFILLKLFTVAFNAPGSMLKTQRYDGLKLAFFSSDSYCWDIM